MKHLISALAISLMASWGALAIDNQEQEFDSSSHHKVRADWGAASAREKNLERHTKYNLPNLPVRIMIGHTVTDLGDSRRTLQSIQNSCLANANSADIGYTTCFDKNGFRWDCRPYEYVPAILQGHNVGSCIIGLIGNFHEEAVTDEMVLAWSHHIANIAGDLGFDHIERGRNIFAMSEKNPARYPISPGQHFMARFDEIVAKANTALKKLKAPPKAAFSVMDDYEDF
jgi:hypothetical protein